MRKIVAQNLFGVCAAAALSVGWLLVCTSSMLAQNASAFNSAGNLVNARLAHTATLRADGRVLVAGGGQGPDLIDGFWVVSGAELFDPGSNDFIPAGTSAHDLHTATQLQSGQVLLTGGEADGPFLHRRPTCMILSTGDFSLRKHEHRTRVRHGNAVAGWQSPDCGGVRLEGLNWKPLSTAEIYEPTTGAFSKTGSMSDARYFHTATILVDRERRVQ